MVRKNEFLTKVDEFVGAKIQNLRIAKGYSRRQLSSMINVSNQQLHKYEIGVNRICIGRLMMIARALSEDVSYFYNGVQLRASPKVNNLYVQHQRLCIEVSRNFMKIQNEKYRNVIKSLVKIFATGNE